ncbi:type II toxin-antitoxin system RelE/ParE family toxin [Silvimonas sp. JCM 19000]
MLTRSSGGSKKVEWVSQARKDLQAILQYIAAANPRAARALADDIFQKVSDLRSQSKIYRVGRVAGTRELVVRSSYCLIYRDEEQCIYILRVLHTAMAWP